MLLFIKIMRMLLKHALREMFVCKDLNQKGLLIRANIGSSYE